MAGFYSSREWARIRARQLGRSPLCEGCERAPAIDVDHIKPISEGGAKRDPANLQSLCKPCHSAKTNAQRRGRAWVPEKLTGCDERGMPLDPTHPWYAPPPAPALKANEPSSRGERGESHGARATSAWGVRSLASLPPERRGSQTGS